MSWSRVITIQDFESKNCADTHASKTSWSVNELMVFADTLKIQHKAKISKNELCNLIKNEVKTRIALAESQRLAALAQQKLQEEKDRQTRLARETRQKEQQKSLKRKNFFQERYDRAWNKEHDLLIDLDNESDERRAALNERFVELQAFEQELVRREKALDDIENEVAGKIWEKCAVGQKDQCNPPDCTWNQMCYPKNLEGEFGYIYDNPTGRRYRAYMTNILKTKS